MASSMSERGAERVNARLAGADGGADRAERQTREVRRLSCLAEGFDTRQQTNLGADPGRMFRNTSTDHTGIILPARLYSFVNGYVAHPFLLFTPPSLQGERQRHQNSSFSSQPASGNAS